MEISASNELAPLFLGMPLFLTLAMVICLSFLTACASVYIFRQMTRPDRSQLATHAEVLMSGHSAFLFSGETLVFSTPDGQDLLTSLEGDQRIWDKLCGYLGAQDPDISDKLQALETLGAAFRHNIVDQSGISSEVTGRPQKGFVFVSLRKLDLEVDTPALLNGNDIPDIQQSADLQALLNAIPFPIWSRSKDGHVNWSNQALRSHMSDEVANQRPDALSLPSAFTQPEDETDIVSERRVSINVGDGSEQKQTWFKIFESLTENQDILGYAIDANEIVNVERSLRRFVATLTESFAQLSTGLAIFNADRRLTIFNPAIADLLQLDPGWLASSPGFRDFMSHARESQMIPEQKTSVDWKNMVRDIEKGAEDGTLSDKWVLPSGQTFKVTGRPHPHGAIALMIEDISTHISLERSYRSEIEQSRTTLDYLTEAVCVFDTAGELVYANSAFNDMWDFDLNEASKTQNIVSLSSIWGSACKPTPVWGDLREFVTSLDQRATWTSDIELLDGRVFDALFAPLPDGSTLTTFTSVQKSKPTDMNVTQQLDTLAREHAAEISILELAIDHMREAVQTLTEKQDTSPDQKAQSTDKADPVRDIASYTDRLLLLRQGKAPKNETVIETLSRDLAALLDDKNANLDLSCEPIVDENHLTLEKKRLLINIMLVVRSLVAPEESVDLSVAEMKDGLSLSCMFRGYSEQRDSIKTAGLPYRILARYIQERGGEVELDRLDDRGLIKISCTIPTIGDAQNEPVKAKNIA